MSVLPARGGGAQWWLFIPSPLTGAFFGLLGALSPELRAAMGVGYGGIAAIFVAQTVGTIGGAAVSGISRSRLFRPAPMSVAVAVSLCLTLAVDDWVALMPLMLVAGFGCYAVNVRAQADLSLIAGERRARVLGLFHVFGGLGFTTFPLCVAALLHVGAGWRAPFALVASFFACYAVVCLFWEHSGDPPALRLFALRRIAQGRAGAALVAACLGTGLQFAVPLWIPILMRDRFGWSTAAASLTAAIYMCALVLSRLASVVLVTRVSGHVILVVAATFVVLGHVILAVAWSPFVLVVAAIAIGGGAGPLLPVGIARVAHWSRDDRLGTAVVMGLAGLSQIVLPAMVVGAHAAGLSLQHAVSVTIVAAIVVLAAARRA